MVSRFAGKGNAETHEEQPDYRLLRALGRYIREAERYHTLKSTEVEPLSSCTNS